MKSVLYLLLALVTLLCSCGREDESDPLDRHLEKLLQEQSPEGQIDFYQLPSSDNLGGIPAGRRNPLTKEKVALGRMLFYETGLAQGARKAEGRGTYSCATCHVPAAGFLPGRPQGIGDGGYGFGRTGEGRMPLPAYMTSELDVQGVRPMSLLNTAYAGNTTWSGKFGAHFANEGTDKRWDRDTQTIVNYLGLDGPEAQCIEDIKTHRMVVNRRVVDSLGYKAMFDTAFPDFPVEKRYGLEAAGLALAAYLRTLLPTGAPFQQWLAGDRAAMEDGEKRGAIVFFGKAGCVRCHDGPALSSADFFAVGARDLFETGALATGPGDTRNLGRGGFTGKPGDMFLFRSPQLYNLADASHYFHGASKRSLREVVDYFNRGIPENLAAPHAQISPFFQPLNLSPGEIDDLVDFLRGGLRDPDLKRFMPDHVLSGNCFPNNDGMSRKDLGCK